MIMDPERYRRLCVATGIPSAVLASLCVDPAAKVRSVALIVKQSAGTRALREALAAPTFPARARILLPAIIHQRRADEEEERPPTSRRRAA